MAREHDLSVFLDDNDRWKRAGKRAPWNERLRLIEEHFPHVRDVDFNVVLRDERTFSRLLTDILKVDQIEAGRAGPRPPVEHERGMALWNEWTGADFSRDPFPVTFRRLAGKQSYTQIARRTGLSRPKVFRLMKGTEDPTVSDLRAIADAYGKRPGHFAEYRVAYILALFAAKVELDPDRSVRLYLRLARTS